MKKTIWVPIVIGLMAGELSYLILVADFRILLPLGSGASLGGGEIFATLAAALGGPIAAVITGLLNGAGGYLITREVLPWPTSLYMAGADLIAHIIAMLVAAVCYRFLHERAKKKLPAQLAGWVLIVAIYYFVVLTFIQVLLLNALVPGFGAYMDFVSVVWPEFLATAIVTTLIWFALPARYRRPLWYEPKQATDQNVSGAYTASPDRSAEDQEE
jgi:hypothetical protein